MLNLRQFVFSVVSPSSSPIARPSGIISPGRFLPCSRCCCSLGLCCHLATFPLSSPFFSGNPPVPLGAEVAPASMRKDEWSFVTVPKEEWQWLCGCKKVPCACSVVQLLLEETCLLNLCIDKAPSSNSGSFHLNTGK